MTDLVQCEVGVGPYTLGECMSTYQDQLISRVIREGKTAYQEAREFGLTLEDLPSGEPSAIWKTFEEYFTAVDTHGSLPGEATVQLRFPQYKLRDDPGMTTAALLWEVRKERIARQADELLRNGGSTVLHDPVRTLSLLQSQIGPLLELGASRKTDVDFRKEITGIIADYEAQEAGEYVSAAAWPWESLQKATGGLSKEDFIVFYGRPKSMKTWVFCYLLAHMFEQGKSILLYTKEMTPRNIFKRIASCLAKIPYQDLRSGGLSPGDKSALMDIYMWLQDPGRSPLIALSAKDVAGGGDTVAWLRAKVERYAPDVVGIDGMYLMSDGKGGKSADWSRVTSISRDISAMRLELETPVIATMQANRKAAGHNNAELDEMAYADAVGQDATLAARVINEKGKPTIALVIGGSREFFLHGIRIGGTPGSDFDEKELLTEKDIVKAKQDDAVKEEEGSEDPAAHAKPRKNPKTNGHMAVHNAMLEKQFKSI